MRFVRPVFSIWLVAVTIRFCLTLYQGLRSPFNLGDDLEWALIWIVAALVLAVLYTFLPARTVTRAWIVTVGVAAVAVIVLSGSLIAMGLAVWLTVLCAGLGIRLLRIAIPADKIQLEHIVCAVPIGFGALALAVLALGLLKALTPFFIYTLLAASTLFVVPLVAQLRVVRPAPQVSGMDSGFLIGLILLSGLFNLIWALAPEIHYDALNYHLFVPQQYLQHSAIVEIEFLHAYFARLVEFFLTICLSIGGVETAKLWIFLMSLFAVLGVYALGRALFDSRIGLWAAAFFYTTPLVSWLSTTAYIDNLLALFVAASCVAVVRWHETKTQGWIYVVALIAGIAIGSKANAVFAFLVILPAIAIRAGSARTVLTALLLFAVTALPSYALVYGFTGNPIFPLLNGVFQSPKWESTNTLMNAADYGLDQSLSSLVRFPFRLTLDTKRFGEASPRGSVGFVLLLAFPFAALLLRQRRPVVTWLLLACAVYLLLLFYTIQYARYYIPILPLTAVLGVAAAFYLSEGRTRRLAQVCLLLSLILQPIVTAVQFWSLPERYPVELATGSESRDAFLGRTLSGYRATQFLNGVSSPESKILGVDSEHLRFYLQAEMEIFALSLQNHTLRQVAGMSPGPELAAELKKSGFEWMLVSRSAAADPKPWFPYLQPEFLRTYARQQYVDEWMTVYRLED